MSEYRIETDSLGEVKVPQSALWGAQTQRATENFTYEDGVMPLEMVRAYGVLKKGCALANRDHGILDAKIADLICRVCDELETGQHDDMFPLPVWISGSGTQFNMNVNEVISNRCCQLAGNPLGAKDPVHPNNHVNLSQSTNDNFPSAIYMVVATEVTKSLIPSITALQKDFAAKAEAWRDIVKIGRTHLQDATPLTLGQEFSGYAVMLAEDLERVRQALEDVYLLPLGGTAVGTGLNAFKGFAESAIAHIAHISGLPFAPTKNRFAVQGAHDALVQMSGTIKTLATSLNKIANDIRLLGCGPRAGLGELILPANEPGSSIMPGKVNPTQCESLSMVSLQAMANDAAVTLGGTSGILDMNVYKPLMLRNLLHSIHILTHGMDNFRVHLMDGLEPDRKRIAEHVGNSLMLVTPLARVIGYDNAADIALHAHHTGSTLREAALELKLVSAEDFDRIVVPEKMLEPGD